MLAQAGDGAGPDVAAAATALAIGLGGVLAGAAAATIDDRGDSAGGGKVDVVGYSTPETVYEEGLEPGFNKTSAGAGVSFSNSFGASGDQSRAVEAGQPASLVHFSQAGDMSRLVDAGVVDKNWDKQKYKGIAENSVVVFVVRKGNPDGIKTFDDLINKDVSVVTPNPFSSGSARWNIMAIYGSQIERGQVARRRRSTRSRPCSGRPRSSPGSGRDALAAFTQGEGDVLLSYENEAITAQKDGRGRRLRHPRRHDPDPDPDRGDQGRAAGGAGFPRLHLVGCRPEGLGRERLPPRQPGAGRQEEVPDAEGPVHDRQVRRLGQGQRRVLRRDHRLGGEDRGADSESPPPAEHGGTHGDSSSAPGRDPPARGRRRPRPRHGRALPERDRAAAAGRGRRPVAEGRTRLLLGRRQRRPVGRRPEADGDRLADRRRHQRASSGRSSPGSWSATSSPARRSSTRSSISPSRCRRSSPASP